MLVNLLYAKVLLRYVIIDTGGKSVRLETVNCPSPFNRQCKFFFFIVEIYIM